MRKRNVKTTVNYTREEYEDLKEKAMKAGCSREAFIRKAISGTMVLEAPPVDYAMLIREIRYVGNCLNQLCVIAHTKCFVDLPQLESDRKKLFAIEQRIFNAYDPKAWCEYWRRQQSGI